MVVLGSGDPSSPSPSLASPSPSNSHSHRKRKRGEEEVVLRVRQHMSTIRRAFLALSSGGDDSARRARALAYSRYVHRDTRKGERKGGPDDDVYVCDVVGTATWPRK